MIEKYPNNYIEQTTVDLQTQHSYLELSLDDPELTPRQRSETSTLIGRIAYELSARGVVREDAV